tara:strand:+ start:4093 stop:4338 length:246 start_codon:yes stop_codon:yes gene_type:complete
MKSKALAVILAILFSFFTFLYTYEKDKKKFWILLVIWLLATILSPYLPLNVRLVMWGIVTLLYFGILVYQVGRDPKFFTNY